MPSPTAAATFLLLLLLIYGATADAAVHCCCLRPVIGQEGPGLGQNDRLAKSRTQSSRAVFRMPFMARGEGSAGGFCVATQERKEGMQGWIGEENRER